MATSVPLIRRPNAFTTIAGGGLLAGLLDGAHAVIYYSLIGGIPTAGIFRYIASGLIGSHAAAKAGGLAVLLGVALHFCIAIGAAAVYYFAACRLAILIRRPFVSGITFGVGLYLFMNYIVIPLSAVPKNPNAAFSWADFASEIFAHVVLVGLPIALMARHSALAKPLEGTRSV